MKPSRWYYGLAILVFIGGVVSFALFLHKNLNSLSNSLTQVVMPGKWDITLPMTGKYTIFHEYRSVVGNRVFSTEQSVSDLQCILTSKATGSQVMLFRPSAESTYSFGGREGVSVLEFNIEHIGTYEFSAQYPEGKEGPEIILTIVIVNMGDTSHIIFKKKYLQRTANMVQKIFVQTLRAPFEPGTLGTMLLLRLNGRR